MLKLILGSLLLIASLAHAETKVGIMGSVLWNTTQNDQVDDIEGSEEKSKPSFGFGMRALVGLNDRVFLRTGASVIQKKFEFDFPGPLFVGGQTFTFTYFNIPATLYLKASPTFGIFAGTALQAKIDDSCEGSFGDGTTTFRCQVEDDNTLILPAVIGFDLIASEKISIEISYEYGLMETMKDTKVSSVVASLIFNL